MIQLYVLHKNSDAEKEWWKVNLFTTQRKERYIYNDINNVILLFIVFLYKNDTKGLTDSI